jgi:hypothetical protein
LALQPPPAQHGHDGEEREDGADGQSDEGRGTITLGQRHSPADQVDRDPADLDHGNGPGPDAVPASPHGTLPLHLRRSAYHGE